MAEAATLSPEKTANKPVKVFRNRGLSASVFPHRAMVKDRSVTFHNVTLQRTYKVGEEFKTTSSLDRDDVPVAILLLQRAWEFILETDAKRGKDDDQK